MKQIFSLVIIALTFSITMLAQGMTQIAGNPVQRQDDYSINTNVSRWIDVQCLFINSGNKPADLKVWTNPNSTIPTATIHLKKASKLDHYKIKKRFHLQLKKEWWCQIHTPKEDPKKWAYCAYFSISDATIAKYRPFKVWNKTILSKDTTYHCRLLRPNQRIRFFYFKNKKK